MGIKDANSTIAELFEIAFLMERKANKLYLHFKKIFSHIPEVSTFWKELANDEIKHGIAIKKISDSLTKKQLDSPPDAEIMKKMIDTQNKIDKIMVVSIKTLDDAYELAHELESSEVNVIFKFLVSEFIPVEERVNFIVSEINSHQNKLIDFKEKFGDRSARTLVKANNGINA